ncbi:GntR family transcriptional regulator [Jannaschia sp. S6380]|uniref:GntR family transcriptional regulator n=1 Tax=Jannaschia sp. S6380 TaxID=2926408 RepID=UPI001FF3E7F2|nr:GntR family transcriptional regulator [Jannaschia sp. S6380]MCK0167220.1 GntR family transcriptional regulator [Jannaschia sp. S6380]
MPEQRTEADRPARTTSAAGAYEALRARIVSGGLKPGDRIREVELAQEMGLSRTPVREAIKRLEQDGLIRHAPHKGAVVRALDPQSMNELYLVREVLEGTAAGLAAQHASTAEITALEELLATQPPEGQDDGGAEAARRNAIFHDAIGHAAHNRHLLHAMDGLSGAMALLGPTTLSMPGRIPVAMEEHAAILHAISARDAGAADAAARAHIRAAHRARLHLLYGIGG